MRAMRNFIGRGTAGMVSLVFINVCFYVVSGQERLDKIPQCDINQDNEVKYKVVYANRGIREPYTLGLRIVVKEKQVNREFILKLAESLRRRYCMDNDIGATIFDDKEIAKSADAIVDQLLGKKQIPEIRGFYSLDRKNGIEKVSFSSKRGNPPDEIVIDLASN